MIRRPPRSTQSRSSAASDGYKRQVLEVPREQLRGQERLGGVDLILAYAHLGQVRGEEPIVQHLVIRVVRPCLGRDRVRLGEVAEGQRVDGALAAQSQDGLDVVPLVVGQVDVTVLELVTRERDLVVEVRDARVQIGIDALAQSRRRLVPVSYT